MKWSRNNIFTEEGPKVLHIAVIRKHVCWAAQVVLLNYDGGKKEIVGYFLPVQEKITISLIITSTTRRVLATAVAIR